MTTDNNSEHPSFPQPEDTSTHVWRYLDLAKFIWLLDNKKLYFPRIDLLNDPHEGSIPEHQANQLNSEQYKLLMKEQWEPANALRALQESKVFSKSILKKHYVNCWYLNNAESEAMWRLYCPNNNGIAIQTTYKKLAKSVHNIERLYMGYVTYLDYDTQSLQTNNFFNQIMHKRLSFSHEKEVRLVLTKRPENEGTPQEKYVDGISIDWPVESTVEAIYINPYAPEYFQDVVRSMVTKIAPSLAERVLWSKMRAKPVY